MSNNDGYNHLELNTSRYYIALCNYALKDKNTSNVIDDFLRDYPDHKLSEKLRFTKGKYKFDRKKYRASIQLFSMVDEKQLNNEELLELHFKRGYAHFYFKEFQNALTHFIEIRDIPSKYTTHAIITSLIYLITIKIMMKRLIAFIE